MVFRSPASFLFFSVVGVSAVYVVSAPNWVSAWLALEINMLAFIPTMMVSGGSREAEGAVKYFLAQAVGSILFLLGGLGVSGVFAGLWVLTVFGLFMKAGMAPCHAWFPQVMSAMSWPVCMMLSSWQKVAPLLLLFYFNSYGGEVIFVGCIFSAIVGAVGVVGQSHMRSLMAYSSINHMGWMVGVSGVSYYIAFNYLMIYILMILPLMFSFNSSSVKSYGSPGGVAWWAPSFRLSSLILMLSLGGVPPFLGFFPKAMVISCLGVNELVILAGALIISSLVTLYVYLNVFFFYYIKDRPANEETFYSYDNSLLVVFGSSGLGVCQLWYF